MKFPLVVLAALSAVPALAQITTITDKYIGNYDPDRASARDAIGSAFNISSLTVDFRLSTISATVNSTYFRDANIGRDGTQPGDLFISAGYRYTATTYFADGPTEPGQKFLKDTRDETVAESETWEYVVKAVGLERGSNGKWATSGQVHVYAVGPGTILGTDYRKNHEFAYSPAVGQKPIGTGTWTRSGANLTYAFPFLEQFQTSAFAANGFGFHWTMSCGNDIIEGFARANMPKPPVVLIVPEPASTAVLLLLAVSTLLVTRRRRS